MGSACVIVCTALFDTMYIIIITVNVFLHKDGNLNKFFILVLCISPYNGLPQ